jgi:hypothetical protein
LAKYNLASVIRQILYFHIKSNGYADLCGDVFVLRLENPHPQVMRACHGLNQQNIRCRHNSRGVLQIRDHNRRSRTIAVTVKP